MRNIGDDRMGKQKKRSCESPTGDTRTENMSEKCDYELRSFDALQDKYSDIVNSVLTNIRSEKVSNSVSKLDSDQLDTLMKYVYKALSNADNKSSTFLKWHGEIVKKTGTASVIRFITDRKTA